MKILTFTKIIIVAFIGVINTSYANDFTDAISIKKGSGSFIIEAGPNHPGKKIKVFYHKPKNFDKHSPILMVIPGAGRNGDTYRDSWVAASEQYSSLILSPAYPKEDFEFSAYHFGGVIENMKFKAEPQVVKFNKRKVFKIDDKDLMFDVSHNPEKWIFDDFDHLFDRVKRKLGSVQVEYDVFGHSAGGQIAHRLALFHPYSKANRILAGNSGSFTLPEFETALPFGLKNSLMSDDTLKHSLRNRLVLFLGELDNADETGGSLLHTPIVNRQGLHRLARGQYFYQQGWNAAKRLGTPFNWKLEVVPGIGHNYRKMGEAAAQYLYGTK
jgi:pimeloyl-ACP methyl ester carboxylesterase